MASARQGFRHRLLSRLHRLLGPGIRTWVFTVPLHLLAFVVLYLATTRILEKEIVAVTSDTVSSQMALVAKELHAAAVEPSEIDSQNFEGHRFDEVLATHQQFDLEILAPDASALDPDVASRPSSRPFVVAFLAGDRRQMTWLGRDGNEERMHGLLKIAAGGDCVACHTAGDVLAVASMSVDVAAPLGRARFHARRNLALLIVAWSAALGLSTVALGHSARRLASRFEAQLAAAEAGESTAPEPEVDLVLDPTSARLQESLRGFLARHRDRQAEVASRLAHTSQLASLGQLAAGLAHEIKNPLAGIQGALEILSEDSAEPSTVRLCDEMLSELQRVNETLQAMLSSARPSPPRLAMTDLREVLEEQRRLLEPGLRKRGVVLEMNLPDDSLSAHVDVGKIRQILTNLIGNAGDAAASGGRIVVDAESFEVDGGGVIVFVRDDGPGIAGENLDKIFEPFFSTKFTGAGLGLAIARSLAEQHGGSLHVESQVGEGATFILILPGEAPEERPPGSGSEPPS